MIFMYDRFVFLSIKQYDNYVIDISEKDYKKMLNSIKKLKEKYNGEILKLYSLEKLNSIEFDFFKQRKFIEQHKQIILSIINDVLKIYRNELNNLIVVFLSGSFARGTNKMSSDIDLHFFYKNDNYNYIYEEIVSYIISRIVNKSRDCIDPTFIFNIESDNKSMITNKMNNSKLTIILKYKKKEIKYSYKYGKKRRFYLQYINTRNINKLFDYLNNEVIKHNNEWCHCFEIIQGKFFFNKLYGKMYNKELNIISDNYINNKIHTLIKKIKASKKEVITNSISQYKNYYQSKTFEWIYEYISILRFVLIKENNVTKYLNLLGIYDEIENNSKFDKNVLIEIYRYMWSLEKLSIYCYENRISYGLHNSDRINYSTEELDGKLKLLKGVILSDLERLGRLYE